MLLRLGQQPDQLLHQDRRQPLGRLVEQQEARAHPQHPRDGQHLLLAAR